MLHYREDRKETLVYIVMWALVFLAPLASVYIHSLEHDATMTADVIPWGGVFAVWRQALVFLVAFLVHNYLLAPLLLGGRRRVFYFCAIAVLLSLFVTVQCISRPDTHKRHRLHERMEMRHGPKPDESGAFETPSGFDHRDMPPRHDGFEGNRFEGGKHQPPILIGEHDLVATIVFLLMLGVNWGIKLYFRHLRDRERMALLERENLEQQLEYLKYQINPHFLMNTLNNIHALVDIDPEQAKDSIVQLSKIMRFVLYEGSKQMVPLRQEILYLQNYIELMRKRVADQVDIRVSLPDMLPDREVPPLMLITFVENAFKHGVSYQQPSFINIRISIDGSTDSPQPASLHFVCSNSKIPQAEDRHGGVGLQNAKRRLDLLYADRYDLHIDDAADTYTVTLQIPLGS